MSIVQPELPGARVLDLFAGSGALGLEALSRGAEHCDFVEMASRSLAALRANVDKLGAEDATIIRGDALKFIERLDQDAYDIVFADPPYGLNLAVRVAERWLAVPFASLLGVEHSIKEAMPAGGETRKYGDTGITFYRTHSTKPLR
jgi:16S rRNA (guanine966-N2)-methyltransferase